MAEPPPPTTDMAAASTSNDSTDAPDVVMGDNANHRESGLEASLLSKKRKANGEDAFADANAVSNATDEHAAHPKKAKRDAPENPVADRSHLPAEVWHHIFSFCPPRTLGNLLIVNKLFNSYLDPASPVVVEKRPPPLAKPTVKAMEPNAIWRNARRSFWPNMPAPLKEKTELDMWRLACSPTCQFCCKRDTRRALPATDPFRFGPGADGVARIWEFRVRCCGPCLSKMTLTEMDLVLSAASTFLIPALQFVFVTSNSCVVPLNVIERGQLPPSSILTKIFWSSDVESLREEFASVRELGASAAEEWQKGLLKRGSDQRADITKWEKYADSGGVANMRTLLHPGIKVQSAVVPEPSQSTERTQLPTAAPADKAISAPAEPVISQKSAPAVVTQPLPAPVGREKTIDEIDAEWDVMQGPVRLKILKYADEAIIGDWDDGDKVTKDNAPAFAVDVLLHVRKRFYMEVEKDAKAARAVGREPVVDPVEGPFTQKLTLENMKYVFDVKVRPISSKFRTELFLCPLCDANMKFFGFEGAIQHYAAKHTNILSVGNIVVYWRAEWPEEPPFRKNPRVAKGSAMPVPLPQTSTSKHSNQRGPGPVAKRAGKDNQQFPTARAFPYQAPSPHLLPPPPAPHLLPPPPAMPPPPPPPPASVPAPPFQPGQRQPQLFPVSINSEGQSHYSGPSIVAAPQQAHTFGAPSYSQAVPPQTGPAAFHPPPFHPHSQPAAYEPFVGTADRGVGPFPATPNPPPQPFGATAPAPSMQKQVANPFAAHEPYQSHSSTVVQPPPPRKNDHDKPAPKSPYQMRLDELVQYAHGLWNDTIPIRHIPDVVKIQTLLFHTNKHYRQKFGEQLPLALFKDRLLKSKDMALIRTIVDLPCQACIRGLDYVPGTKKVRTLFQFPDLIAHFSQTHVEGRTKRPNLFIVNPDSENPPRDWLKDMLLLPRPSALKDMVNKAQKALQPLLSEALQDALNPPKKDVDEAHLQRQASGNGKAPIPQQAPSQAPQAAPPKMKNGGPNGSSREAKQAASAEKSQTAERALPSKALMVTVPSQETKPASGTNSQQKHQKAHRNGKTREPVDKPTVTVKQEVREHDHPFISTRNAPTRNAAALVEGQDLLGALEMHLDGEPVRRPSVARERPAPTRVPARVVYIDEYGREVVPRHDDLRDFHRDSRGRPRDDDPHAQYAVDERGEPYPRRPLSPPSYLGSYGLASRVPSGQYRERSPPPVRRYADEPVYSGYPRDYEDVYERAPPPVPAHHYVRGPPRQEYYSGYTDAVDRDGRAYRPAEYDPYEAYEVVRVAGPEGEYLARRSVRREAPPVDRRAPERYYSSSTAASAPVPYESAVVRDAGGRVMARHEYADDYRAPSYGARYDPYAVGPVHERRAVGGEIGPSGGQRAVAPPQRSVARADPAYYDEYDPHDPTNGGAMQGGPGQMRYQ